MRKMTQHKQKNLSTSSKRHPKEVVDNALHSLNADIDRLGQSILPKHPYLISVPSDVPYRHSSRFVHTWFIGTPFDRREEQLQYLSFLPHQDDYEELLRVVGGWSDDRGSFLEEEPSPKTAYNSGRNTPLDQASRKKISFNEYRKDKMAPDHTADVAREYIEDRENIQSRSRSDTEGSEADLKENPSQSEDTHDHNQSQGSNKQQPAPSKLVSHFDGALSDLPSSTIPDHDMSPRPNKRRKLSESPDSRPTIPEEKDVAPNPMPRLLSPTLPSPKPETTLPELLSPLLPPTLVRAIATPPPQPHADNGHQHHRSESVRSILANAISEGSPRPDSKSGPASGSLGNRVRSDSAHSVRSNTSAGPLTNKTVAALKPATPNLSPSRSPRPRQRHIIALKYGKKNRKRVEALLKFVARPKKIAPPPRPPIDTAETASSRDPKPQPSSSVKVSKEKSTDTTFKSKPPRESLNHVKRPTTPVPSIKEPKHSPTPTSSANKSVHATPKKEHKPTAMRRVESMEGGDPSTPGPKGRSSTPLSVARSSNPPKSSPGPTSAPHSTSEDRQAWFDIHQKHHQLGRSIKHDATDNNQPGSQRFAVLLVEALLSFMISDTVQILSRPSANAWESIEEYLVFVLRGTKKHPHLYGLALQIGAVCRQQIQKYYIDRLAKDPLPEDYIGSAPTPGSDGNTKTHEDGQRYKSEYLKRSDNMVTNARALQDSCLDGSRKLSPELLRTDYPKTWGARRLDFERRGMDRPSPNNIPKDYYLPIDAATTPFEAVKFGLAFLAEWTDINGVSWETSIDL